MFSLWFDRELVADISKVLYRPLCEKKVIDLIQHNLDRTPSMRKFFQCRILWWLASSTSDSLGGGGGGIIFYIRFPGVGVVNIRFPGWVSSKTNSLGWVSSTSDSFIRVGVVKIIFPGGRVVNIRFFHKGGCHQHQWCKQQIPHDVFGQNQIPLVACF